ALAVGLIQGRPAVLLELLAEAHLEVVVTDEAGELVVLLDQLLLARDEVDPVDVVELRLAVVEADQQFLGKLVADALYGGAELLGGGEVVGLLLAEVDAVDVEVLVAVLVLDVEDVLAGVGPEVGADATLLVVGDGFGVVGAVDGADPDVEDALDGGEVA